MESLKPQTQNSSSKINSTPLSSSYKTTKRSMILHPPTLITVKNPKTQTPFILEYSIHKGSTRFTRELKNIFPKNIKEIENCLILPIFLKCHNDLVGVGSQIDMEKDERLEHFVEWGKFVCKRLRERGYWADITDPASGYPILSEAGVSTYPDVQGSYELLKYDVLNAGCCSILLHPNWGSKVYPGTLFTDSNQDDIIEGRLTI
ncbi:10973_t:CDS:2 [Entrophospora sp. SA101]|nr:7295_t:CDS:2 [Entrophospora candida]CAG8578926.1 11416_t:CDS:2 [Entrophospora candida]CAJ0640738.1 10973_t:CDS:2 [Entrophospora sp. SA101]CAJ0844983.1 8706_t:CDS:2 [Entrophospora sp. SA101]